MTPDALNDNPNCLPGFPHPSLNTQSGKGCSLHSRTPAGIVGHDLGVTIPRVEE